MKKSKRIVYALSVQDIQDVAQQTLERDLTDKEIAVVENHVEEYVNWFDAIELAINRHVVKDDETAQL